MDKSKKKNDDIVFETFYHRSGKEFQCIYQSGMRFYSDDSTHEWMPFPKRWYNEGLLMTNHILKDETDKGNTKQQTTKEESHASKPRDRNENTSRDIDDREGFLMHPAKGRIPTYIFYKKHNVHMYFDRDTGSWLCMPICWELHHEMVKSLVDQVDEAVPCFGDRQDILALLRACNYDPDECIRIYKNLENDEWMKEPRTTGEDKKLSIKNVGTCICHGGKIQRKIDPAPPLHIQHMSNGIIRLPGLIDVHVDVRESGDDHAEDWTSCTAAALAGGITMILAIPMSSPPISGENSFNMATATAKTGARCDYGLFLCGSADNSEKLQDIGSRAAALKLFMNDTLSTIKLNDVSILMKHFEHWPTHLPLCIHAEGSHTAAFILLADLQKRPLHICDVTCKEEILIIKAAKARGLDITCEVTPHLLFLTTSELSVIKNERSEGKPVHIEKEDQDALWEHLSIIDCFATDHASLCKRKPINHSNGLELMLPLLLNAVSKGRLSLEDLVDKLHTNPKKIFNLPDQPDTYLDVDLHTPWIIPKEMKYSKAQWTPFAGVDVKGKVQRVVLRGVTAFEAGEVLAKPGYGKDVRQDANYIKQRKTLGDKTRTKPTFADEVPGQRDVGHDASGVVKGDNDGECEGKRLFKSKRRN